MDKQITLTLTERQARIVEFALWRFMNDAISQLEYYSRTNAGLTDEKAKEKRHKFAIDANDAEQLVGTVRKSQEVQS